MKTKKNIMEILKHVYLLIITFIVLTPIYYLLVTTLSQELKRLQSRWHFRLPGDITPYINAFEKCSIQERLEILLLLQYVRYLAL